MHNMTRVRARRAKVLDALLANKALVVRKETEDADLHTSRHG
jgi:hypothetical protein